MKNLSLLLIVVILATFPLFLDHGFEDPAIITVAPSSSPLVHEKTRELFTGADRLAEDKISQINPDYEPWFASLWEPPSGEIESLLFVLQAVIGAGALFYFLGYIRGRNSARKEH